MSSVSSFRIDDILDGADHDQPQQQQQQQQQHKTSPSAETNAPTATVERRRSSSQSERASPSSSSSPPPPQGDGVDQYVDSTTATSQRFHNHPPKTQPPITQQPVDYRKASAYFNSAPAATAIHHLSPLFNHLANPDLISLLYCKLSFNFLFLFFFLLYLHFW